MSLTEKGGLTHPEGSTKILCAFYDHSTGAPIFFDGSYDETGETIPKFDSAVDLKFNEGDLTGEHSFEGQVGPDTITLTFNNGPSLSGQLTTPLEVTEPFKLKGKGKWQGLPEE
jgi:hypothetical protein